MTFNVNATESGTIGIMFAVTLNQNSIIYQIEEKVLNEIRQVLIKPEMGGILGIDKNNFVVKFHHDLTGISTKYDYIPDVKKLNEVIVEWAKLGIKFIGFVHSHRSGRTQLSSVDKKYAQKIKECCNMSEILMMLYIPSDDTFQIKIC